MKREKTMILRFYNVEDDSDDDDDDDDVFLMMRPRITFKIFFFSS